MAHLGKVIEVRGSGAMVDFGGIVREVELGLVEAKEGDLVLVHAGYAIRVVSREEVEGNLREIIENLRDL